MANVLNTSKQIDIIKLLVEGNSIRSIVRFTGCHKKTVTRLLVKVGDACRDFLDREMRGLTLNHVQCDEIWTFVQKKQGLLTVEEKATRNDIGDQYLWVAFDKDTKLIPSFIIGKRSADMARRFMRDLASRLIVPNPHAADRHAYKQGHYAKIANISTDGFAAYPEAVDLAFGPYVNYGQLIKQYRNARMIYTPSEMIKTERKPIFGQLHPSEICTSHVERNNLTIRTFMKRFTRLSLGFSKKLENLAAAVALHMAYFNYCWKPKTLNGITPAIASGVCRELWRVEDLFEAVQS